MDMKNFRKNIFLNSQYCTCYEENNSTILAGILRNCGYKYSNKLSDDNKNSISKKYRKYTAILNAIMALEIVLYVYCVIFPYYLNFMEMPYFLSVLILSIIPLLGLYITYIAVNYFYEKCLVKYLGTFDKVSFRPTLENFNNEEYLYYKNSPKKSVYVLIALIAIFVLYIATPFYITNLNRHNNIKSAYALSNIYLKFVPISSEVYAQKAYAEFKMKKYEQAAVDFEKANKYGMSDVYKYEILGCKTYYLPYNDVLKEFEKAISLEDSKPMRYLLNYELVTYKVKNKKDYNQALVLYSDMINKYKSGESVFFAPELVYYNRGVVRGLLGDVKGAVFDKNIAENMCKQCGFSLDTTLIRKP